MSDLKLNLLGLSRTRLKDWLVANGEKGFRAQQIVQWIHAEGLTDFAQMTNLSKDLRRKLDTLCEIRPPELLSEHLASDGTRKWLFKVEGGSAIESVYIPESERATLCISS